MLQGEGEQVSRDQLCISCWYLTLDASCFMTSLLHFVAIRLSPDTCHSWWFAGLYTLTLIVTFQLSLIYELIASEKGGAGNTDNISVWNITIDRSFIVLFNAVSKFQCVQDVSLKSWAVASSWGQQVHLHWPTPTAPVQTASTIMVIFFGVDFHAQFSSPCQILLF